MNLETIFKINQRLEISLSKNTSAPRYTSRIEELIPNHMIIAMPMDKGRPIIQQRGSAFYGKMFGTTGVYTFKSTFIDKKMNPLPIWIVTMPSDIEKSQHRSFVRFDVSLPVVIEYPLDDNQDEVVTLNLTTKDLSGGGLQVISNKKLKLGKHIILTLRLTENEVLQLNGEVVRINQPEAARQLFWIGIKFLDVTENIRDKVSKFIFRKQLEQRQKGR